jgi:hypothetical protein
MALNSSSKTRMLNGQRVLQPLDPQPRLLEVHLIAPQTYRIRYPQAVPVYHQEQQMITNAVPATPGGRV